MRARTGERARRGDAHASRDQSESAFTSILRALVARIPGAHAAALVDFHGETVDYAGRATPFDIRLAAAHWRIVLNELQADSSAHGLTWLAVRAARASYLVCALPDRYALVVVLSRAAGFVGWHRAVAACTRALAEEAAWKRLGSHSTAWFPVDVVSDARRRPRSVLVAGRPTTVEVLGTVVRHTHSPLAAGDLTLRERGWRVRLDTRFEMTLVREPGGAWYADQMLDGPVKPPGSTKTR
jgi:hypothetical protein